MLGISSSLSATIINAKCVDHWKPCYCFTFFKKIAVIKIREISKDIMSFTLNKSSRVFGCHFLYGDCEGYRHGCYW